MNEYRFTGTDRATGKPVLDMMIADSENDVRAAANERGVEIREIELNPPVRAGAFFSSFLLEVGQFVSLIGCTSPLLYVAFGAASNTFSVLGLVSSLIGALYSAAMFVVFSRVKRIDV